MNWQFNGKPKEGPLAKLMRTRRAHFKSCLRYCKLNEDRARADALASKLLNKDSISFWKEVKRAKTCGRDILASTIDSTVGDKNICNFWKNHYATLLNSCKDTRAKKCVLDFVGNKLNDDFEKFTFVELKAAIKTLKSGKSAGLDGVQSEHFIHADQTVYCLLSMLFNSIFTHGYIPISLIESVIIPIVKDKKGLITDKDNYRPIAVTGVVSKILEILLLDRLQDKLLTCDNQFGFKNKLGTDLCVFTLKQIIEFYKSKNSPVYLCLLDSSKAFDRVNHWFLFSKLIKRGVSHIYIRLFIYWYSTQQFCVRWGDSLSSSFHVSNGVRQGGVMSPVLFNVYMDDLSVQLNNSCIGCSFNGEVFNHILYADDTCIIAPSPQGLSELLGMCSRYAEDNAILFNAKKSKLVCFKPRIMSKLHVPKIYLNDDDVLLVDKVKYLGVQIDNSCCDDWDITRHVKHINVSGNLLIKSFSNCSVTVKTLLSKTFLSNIYCGQLWTSFKQSSFKRVVVAYNNVHRKLFDLKCDTSMSMFYVFNKLDHFNILFRKCLGNFKNRLSNCDNRLVTAIVSSCFFINSSSHASLWHNILYIN